MERTVQAPTLNECPPQVHSIETSIPLHLPSYYSDFVRAKHESAFNAARELYNDIDIRDGKHNLQLLEECRSYAFFSRHKETGKVKVISNSCKLRWCPLCASAKRVRIQRAVSSWLQTVKKPKFLTLTMSHKYTSVENQIASLYRGFRLLRRHKQISRAIRGGIWFFQIKLAKNGVDYHPHLHIAMDANYINKKLLSMEWLNVTGDSYIIDIRQIDDVKEVSQYVARYSAEPCNMSAYPKDVRLKIADVLHGKRLCGKFGSGCVINLKAQRPEDAPKWQRLGSWYDIAINRHNDPVYRQILNAWQSDKAIGYDTCKHLLHQEEHSATTDTISRLSLSSPQLYFEDFVRR